MSNKTAGQLLSSLLDAILEVNDVDDDDVVVVVDSSVKICDDCPGSVPNVQTQSLFSFLRPATGVSGQVSLSDSDDESLFSPVRGDLAVLTFGLLRPLLGSRRLAGEVGEREGDEESDEIERLFMLRCLR